MIQNIARLKRRSVGIALAAGKIYAGHATQHQGRQAVESANSDPLTYIFSIFSGTPPTTGDRAYYGVCRIAERAPGHYKCAIRSAGHLALSGRRKPSRLCPHQNRACQEATMTTIYCPFCPDLERTVRLRDGSQVCRKCGHVIVGPKSTLECACIQCWQEHSHPEAANAA